MFVFSSSLEFVADRMAGGGKKTPGPSPPGLDPATSPRIHHRGASGGGVLPAYGCSAALGAGDVVRRGRLHGGVR